MLLNQKAAKLKPAIDQAVKNITARRVDLSRARIEVTQTERLGLRQIAALVDKAGPFKDVLKGLLKGGSFVLKGVNILQEASAFWVISDSLDASVANLLARPPVGCEGQQGWTKHPKDYGKRRPTPLPHPHYLIDPRNRPHLPSGSGTPGRAAVAGASNRHPTLPPRFPRLRSGQFVSGQLASAYNRLMTNLSQHIGAQRSLLEALASPRPDNARVASLVKRLRGLVLARAALSRALGQALGIAPVTITPELLATPRRSEAWVRTEARRLGGQPPDAVVDGIETDPPRAGDVIDLPAFFLHPAIQEYDGTLGATLATLAPGTG